MDLQLIGKTGIVTGASSGIGRAIAKGLAGEGVHLAITGRRQQHLEELSKEITAEGGKPPVVIVQDAMAEDAPEHVARAALSGLGRVDILINNAGGSRPFKLHTDEETWHEAMTLNFTRHRQLTDRLIDQMMNNGWGRIINITSVVGSSGNPGQANYAAAKAGVAGMSRALARELGSRGVTVNCVAPGFIETDMTSALDETQTSALLGQIPLGRLGSATDIAHAVAFLASPNASYITGTTLHVNGGMYM